MPRNRVRFLTIVSISDLSSLSRMDVDSVTYPPASDSESHDSIGKQSEGKKKKKKSHGNRKLQRYRRKLRKRGKLLETIASLSAASVDQSAPARPKGNVGSTRGETSLYLIPIYISSY